MTTDSDLPKFTVTVHLTRRGDFLVTFEEGAAPFPPFTPEAGFFFAEADEVWFELRRYLPVELATFMHRLRRNGDDDSGQPLPRD